METTENAKQMELKVLFCSQPIQDKFYLYCSIHPLFLLLSKVILLGQVSHPFPALWHKKCVSHTFQEHCYTTSTRYQLISKRSTTNKCFKKKKKKS